MPYNFSKSPSLLQFLRALENNKDGGRIATINRELSRGDGSSGRAQKDAGRPGPGRVRAAASGPYTPLARRPYLVTNIEYSRYYTHIKGVSMRRLSAILIAFAMLFAPVAMPTGAMAMAATGGHTQMAASDHCGETPREEGRTAAETPCCVATCAAVAIGPAPPFESLAFNQLTDHSSSVQFIAGHFAELETPPPRRG